MEKNAHLKLTNTYLYKRMLNIPRIVLLFLCVSFTVPSLAETTTMQLPQLSLSLNNVTIREVFNIIEKNTEYVFIFSVSLPNTNAHESEESILQYAKETIIGLPH